MQRRALVLGLCSVVAACGGERAAGRTKPRPRRPPADPDPGPASLDPPSPPGTRLAASALEERATALRTRHAGRGFTVLVEAPFVVIGDEQPAKLARRAETTIRWSVLRLREAYFRADPTAIVEIYLFGDDTSYTRYARELFDDEPETPYGYYLPGHDALLMNIATGGGTLVHEIVHPFMAANFPASPTWFDEGLASLYEQCDERDGEIVGLPNWRLPDLQAAIQAHALRPLADLCATTTRQFYKQDSGTNYAQARYLCHYLQERGLLREYYRRFAGAVFADPGGHRLLLDLLGVDAPTLEANWRAHVLGLRYS